MLRVGENVDIKNPVFEEELNDWRLQVLCGGGFAMAGKKTSSVNITSGEAALKKVIENVVDQPN